jgi:hypothetical protein
MEKEFGKFKELSIEEEVGVFKLYKESAVG